MKHKKGDFILYDEIGFFYGHDVRISDIDNSNQILEELDVESVEELIKFYDITFEGNSYKRFGRGKDEDGVYKHGFLFDSYKSMGSFPCTEILFKPKQIPILCEHCKEDTLEKYGHPESKYLKCELNPKDDSDLRILSYKCKKCSSFVQKKEIKTIII
jgi:hypothetical protein